MDVKIFLFSKLNCLFGTFYILLSDNILINIFSKRKALKIMTL